jgi:hypothetical protein
MEQTKQIARMALALAFFVAPALANAKESAFTAVRLAMEAPGAKDSLLLKGADARRQVLVTATDASGAVRDFTSKTSFEISPSGIARVEKSGLLIPVADGDATLKAKDANGLTATLPIHVRASKIEAPINFANQIVPIFTKGGCNGGGCHGKSSGQNGFKLSLLGFEITIT